MTVTVMVRPAEVVLVDDVGEVVVGLLVVLEPLVLFVLFVVPVDGLAVVLVDAAGVVAVVEEEHAETLSTAAAAAATTATDRPPGIPRVDR